jgi:hypothetical protein
MFYQNKEIVSAAKQVSGPFNLQPLFKKGVEKWF